MHTDREAPRRPSAGKRRARTVVVGASHWHVPLYVPVMTEMHHMVGLSDVRPDLVDDLADRWDLPGVETDWHRLLDIPDVELAYVFGAHDEMAAVCHTLIERRIPFVVEKPLGISLHELTGVRRAAEEAGVPAAVSLVQRDGPVDAWLAKAGTPVYSRFSFIAGPPERYVRNGNEWMLDPERAGGGCLANLGPHFVDLFLHATNAATAAVDARIASTLHRGLVEDHATLLLSTPGGSEGIVEVGYTFPDSPLKRYCSFSSAGDVGFASIGTDGSATFTSRDGHTENAVFDVDSDRLYGTFVGRVAQTLDEGFRGLPGLTDLEAAMRIIWRAYELVKEGRHDG